MEHFLVAPGGFVLYTCDELKRAAATNAARQKELEQLRAKGGTDTAGRLIGDAAYGTEYATLRGKMDDMRTTARDKNCDFVPGIESPPARASGKPIH